MIDMKKRNIYLIGLLLVVMVCGNTFSIIAAEEADSVMCDEGILKIGDTDADVREKCGKTAHESENEWAYDDATPSFTVYFEEKKVVRITVEH
jgi:hypothetical protein